MGQGSTGGKKKKTIEKKSLSFKKFPRTQLLHTSVRDYVNHLEATNELAQGHLPLGESFHLYETCYLEENVLYSC